MYAETRKPLPSPLQASWQEKREGQHPYAILVHPVVGDVSDLARHALDAEIKAAKSFCAPMPFGATSTPAATLDEGLVNAGGLIRHGGTIVCGDVSEILAH
jgi:hypothetical protein